jgi:uncharacterized protein (TIGR03790 family)
MSKLIVYCAALILSGNGVLFAENPGDEVIVIFNTKLSESKEIADYYAQRRHVPPSQVFGYGLPTTEDMTRDQFRDALEKPLAKSLQSKKLWRTGPRTLPATTNRPSRVEPFVLESKIRYAVLCYGVPLRILRDPNLREPAAESLRPEVRRNEAAVDTELALLPVMDQKLPLAGPLSNPVFGTTNVSLLHPTNAVLLVTRLDGPTASIARGLVDKALEAEEHGLWGRAYFDLRKISDPAYKIGDDWIHNSAEICRHLGFETVVDENPGTFPAGFPMSQIAFYAGWYDENVSGPFAQPVVEFMPGAFAYHLHSFSAASLRTTNKNWVGPLLAKGVTATMGCVAEPYLGGTPDVGVFTARFLYQGFSFGEAAYAAQPVLSWQTTIVGDPLYRPLAKNPDLLAKELEQNQNPLLSWVFLRLLNLNLANGRPMADWVQRLEDLPLTKHDAVLAEKLGDLYEAQGKPSSAVYAYEQALKLNPSPQQRIRLRFTLAEKLPPLGRELEAYEDYQQLLKETPNYPDKVGVYQRLLPLAQKLNRNADAEYYQSQIRLASRG